jgi:hypothetical protein
MENAFIKDATNSLNEVVATMHERGSQYCDTWGKDGCWNLTKSVIKKTTNHNPTQKECEAIALAAFVDQKYSRFAGGYKKDTAIDIIPYIAALIGKLEN